MSLNKYFRIILILLLSYCAQAHGQSTIVDSLTSKTPDTTHIQQLIEKSIALTNSDFNSSLKLAKKSLRYSQEIDFSKGIAKSKFQLAGIYAKLGLFDFAFENLTNAFVLFDSLSLTDNASTSLNNIGNLFWFRKEYEKALKYYKEALNYSPIMEDKTKIAMYANIGMVYFNLGQNDSALYYDKLALELLNEIQPENKYGYAIVLNNMSDLHIEMQQLKKAEKIKSEIRQNYLNNMPNEFTADFYNSFTELYILTENIEKASELLDSCKKYTNLSEGKFALRDFYEIAFKYNFAVKNWDAAYGYVEKWNQLKDSLHKSETNEKIAQLEVLFNLEQKEKENIRLKQESKHAINYRNLFIVISILITSLGIVFFVDNRKMRKLNSKLSEKTTKLHKSNLKLLESNKSKDKFFSIIAHDLKNPINIVKGFSELLELKVENLSQEKIKLYSSKINSSIENLLALLNDLLEWSRTQSEQIKFAPTNTNVSLIANEVIAFLEPLAEKKSIKLGFDIKNDISVYADANMLHSVFRNLIINAIKFTPELGIVYISIHKHNSNLVIKVKDNGVGMTDDIVSKIFILEENTSRSGTNGEEGTGLGLLICKEFIDKHNGTIQVQSKPNNGTTFTVSIPLRESNNSDMN